jgi:dihydrolipoamide dehydrogenase
MVIVIGGGPAGRIASIRLASEEREVTLIENGGIGGQCLHVGCMPVCALNDIARMIHSARSFHDRGLIDSAPTIDFPRIIQEMHAIQKKIASLLNQETRDAGVDIIYNKTGRLEGKEVYAGDEKLDTDAVIAATGSHPQIPEAGGIHLNGIYNPHTVYSMNSVPKELVIIGGGVMAAEFAYIFSRFGSAVTIVSRSRFLKNMDSHLRTLAIKELDGVDIRENTCICSFGGTSHVESVQVKTEGRDAIIGARDILITAGLLPRSEMLNGVKKGPIGEVIVDDHMRTSVPGVYACGDVTGPPYLTPVARHQGIVAADNILGIDRKMEYRYIPQSINLTNELAFCTGDTCDSASLSIPGPAGPGTFWSVPLGDTGLAKIMADPETGQITGMCCAGPGGGLIAGYMAFLMRNQFSVHDFEDFIEVHPSTDGIYGLAKYASGVLKKRNNP